MTDRSYHPARRGTLLGGVWLIGLGIVFLVQQALGLPWSRAWPLFLILAGVASVAPSMLGYGRGYGPPGIARWIAPIVLIGLGVVFLLANLGVLQVSAGELLRQGWPLILIAIGAVLLVGAVWPGQGRRARETLSLDAGPGGTAEVVLRFGAGEMQVSAGRSGKLLEGEFRGGVVAKRPTPDRVELSPDLEHASWWGGEHLTWDLRLAPDIELDLRIEGGASRGSLDLSSLRVRRLDLKTGASRTKVTLPAAGVTAVNADAGAAQLVFSVPLGVAARIHSQMVVGSMGVDESRFPKTGSGRYESADFETATNRVAIEIRGGLGSVRID